MKQEKSREWEKWFCKKVKGVGFMITLQAKTEDEEADDPSGIDKM